MALPCGGERGACCDDKVCRLQGFPAVAMMGVIGAWPVACVVFAGECMTREEPHTGGKNRSGEAS